jgi:hypothetical protein
MSHPGYFYVNDRKYYLYSSKVCESLRDITHLVYRLPFLPQPNTVSVTVGGQAWSNVGVVGDEVTVKLDNLEQRRWGQPDLDHEWWDHAGLMYGPNCEVDISFQYQAWMGTGISPEPTGNLFVTYTGIQNYTIQDGEIIYQLTHQLLPTQTGLVDDPAVSDAPIVITDDTIEYTDDRTHQMEFNHDPETGVIVFNTNRNLLLNPSFEADNATGIVPTVWYWEAPAGNVTLHQDGGLHGENYVSFAGAGRSHQEFIADRRSPYAVSAYFRGAGDGHIQVAFYNVSGVLVGSTYTVDVDPPVADEWHRGYLYLGQPDWESDDTFYPVPTGTESIRVSVYGAGMDCDAVKAEADWAATDFNPLSPTITVEYETDASIPHIPGPDFNSRWGGWPTGVEFMEDCQPEINNINTRECRGYYVGEEYSSTGDINLGCGGWNSGIMPQLTGICDTTVSGYHIQVGRRHFPYAKTSGFNKYRHRATFHRPNPPRIHDVTRYGSPDWASRPESIEMEPMPDTFIDSAGELAMSVVTATGYTREIGFYAEDQRGLPAFHHRVDFATSSGIITDHDWTDESGRATCTYNPPDGRLGHVDNIFATIQTPLGPHTDTIHIYGYIDTSLDYSNFYDTDPISFQSHFGGYPSLSNNLLGYWRIDDDAADTDVADVGPENNDGVLVGGHNTEDVSIPGGKIGRTFLMDGAADYIDLTGLEASQGEYFDVTKPFSVAGWFKWDHDAGHFHNVLCCSAVPVPGQRGWALMVLEGVGADVGKVTFYLMTNYGAHYWRNISTTALTDAVWGFITVSYDGSGLNTGMKVYVNSVEENTRSTVGAMTNFSQPAPELYMGYLSKSSVDEWGLWAKELTQAEINWLYNGGAGRTY